MPTQLLPLGTPVTMLANVAYALPAVEAMLTSDSAATFSQSNTSAFTANQAVTLTAGASLVAGGFLKSSADALVILKRD
jgi:hypothetical protein